MTQGYAINLPALCERQNFTPDQVESASLVFPKGAVPDPLLLWVRIAIRDQDVRVITLPLTQFYKYVDLPEENLGGLVLGH